MFVHTPTTAKNIENIKTSLETSNAVLIQGEIGCGKTLAVDYLSNLLGVKETLIQVDVDDSFDSKDLLGKFSATETPGSFQWIPGPLTLAVEKGYWVLMEDIDLASFDVFSVLLSLLENSTLFISDKNRVIAAHPNFKLIATQQIVVSGDALFSKKNAIPHQELWSTVIMNRIPSNEQCEIVHQMYDRVPLSVLESLASFSESCSTSKVINLRTLLRWGKRVSRRLELQCNEANSSTFISSTIREMLLKEAYDCFVARFPTSGEFEIMFKAICSACGVPVEVAETAILQSKPQHLIGLTDCTFGRITLALKAPSRVTRESRIAFAETRQAMSLLEQLASTVENGEHVLLTGETGVGKTFVVQYLADQVGQNLIVHNLNQQTDTSDFMGGWKPLDLGVSMNKLFTWFNELFTSCFSVEKNAEFLCALQNAFSCRNWEKTIRLIQKGCSSFCQKYLKQGGFSTEIMSQWNELKAKTDETFDVVMQTSSNMAFFYEEGSLVKAWREGHWILLDELNLATTEVLERVSSVLGDVDRLFLTDKGTSEAIPRHKNFCVFANMNPPTDVGKKDLPPSLRSRFTEFYVSEPFNVSDINTIVREYIGFLTPDAKIHEITEFFLDCVSNSKSKLCSLDGESKPPSFSVRTLTRALSYVRKATPYYGFNVSLFDGLLLGFATPLQRQFHKVIESLIVKNIFRGKQPSSPKLPSSPSNGEHVAYEHIWIKAGANKPFNDENFILTDSVKGHLTNLSRAVFANRPVLLEGPTSSGKSSMVQYLAQLTGNTFVRINNHDSTEVQEYLGHYVTDEFGKLRFVDGILVNAVRNGYWVVLDELNLAPTDVLEALNRLLDDNCELFIPDTQETIKPHPGLRIFATQNPAGIYGGRKVLSRAFRNRFLEITVDEIPSDEIIVILKRRYSMPEGFATKVVQIMTNLQLRRQSSQIFAGRHGFITPRDLFRWADRRPSTYQELAEHGFLLLGERCRKETERQIVKDVIESVTKTVICENELYMPSHWPFVNKYYQLIHAGTIDEFKIVWTTSMQRLFTVVGVCLEHLEPVLLVGETGSSKTTVCQLWSALVGVPLRIINFHQHSEAADFLGSLRPVHPDRNDQALFEWRDGPLVECMREGFFILLDEISLTEDSVLERLNSVLEPSRSITLAEKSSGESFVAHEGFRVLATMNPGGDFGKKELSPALRNRFTEVYVRPTTEEGEVATIVSKRLLPQLREKWSVMMARVLCSLSKLVLPSAGGSSTHISIRDIISWVEFMNAVDGKCPEELAFAHGLDALLLDGIGVGSGQVEGAIELLKKTCLREIENVLADLFPPCIGSDMTISSDAQRESLAILSPSSSSIPSPAPFYAIQELVDRKPFWEVLMGMEEPTLPPHLIHRFFFGAPTTQRNLSKLMRSTVLCKAVLLEGSPGVGKTSIVEALGAALGVRVVRINLSEQTDVMDLFGTFLPQVVAAEEAEEDGKGEEGKEKREGSAHGSEGTEEMEGEGREQSVGAEDNRKLTNREKAKGAMFAWSDGVLLQALKEGCWAILDELNLASQSVLEGLNALLDHRAAVFIPEINQSFSAHPNFRIFACQNPLAEGGGRKGLPRSFLNRFVKVRMEAFTREDLLVISQTICPEIPSLILSGMVDFVAELQRETMWKRSFGLRGSPWEFNLRDVLRWASLLRHYEEQCNPMTFAHMLFELRFRTDEDRLRCRAILHKYFLPPKREKTEEDNSSPLHVSDSNMPVSLPLPKTSVCSSDFLLVGSTIVYKGRPLLERLSSEDVPFPPYSSSLYASSRALRETAASSHFASASRSGETNEDSFASRSSRSSFSPSHLDRPLLLLPSQADIVAAILMCAAQSQFAILVGTSGSGKTFSLRTAAALAGATLVTFSIHASCDSVDLLGGFDQVEDKQGEFEWRDSLILEAMVQGHWLVLDNVNYCHASVLDRLNPLVEPNGVLSVNEQGLVQGKLRMIRPHPRFRLFATMNPRYGEISRAMRNRAVELCLSSVPLPSLEGLTLCATAAPALSFRSPSSLRSSPSPLTFPSFSLEGVWSHFSQFHHEFVLRAFGANTLLPISSNLSDAYAAGSPNIFTLLRAASMVPTYLEKLMKRTKCEEEQQRNEEENESKESIDSDDVCMAKVIGTCVLEVLKHCYLENRLGSWRRQIEVLESVIREKYVPLIQTQVLQWKSQENLVSIMREEERSDRTKLEQNIVKIEVEGDAAHTSDNKGAFSTMLRSPVGHVNDKMKENSWFRHMALFEPRVEDAIQAFTLGSPSSFLVDPTTPLCFSSTNSASASPFPSSSRLQLLSRRLLQCRIQRSGMALQKMLRQTAGDFHSLVHSSTSSSSLRTSHSLPDVLTAFVLEQVTDGAVLEEMAVMRREFLQQLIQSSSNQNTADLTHFSPQELQTNEECIEEEGNNKKRSSEDPFSSSMGLTSQEVLHSMQSLLHSQFSTPSQLPRLLSLTRLAMGPYAGVWRKAQKFVEDDLLLFIADSPSVNRAATRVVAVVVDALRRSVSHPDFFQSLLGVSVSYLEEVFPDTSDSSTEAIPTIVGSTTATLSTILSPTVLTTANFASFVSRALLLIEGEAFTALPLSSSTTLSPSSSTLLPWMEQTREALRSCVDDLLENVRRFLEFPFPITADAPLLQPLLSSVHITSPEERQVMTACQKILRTEMKRAEAEKEKGKGFLTVLRPLWEIGAFRAEFALLQKLISLCATPPTMPSCSTSLLGASSLVMDIGVFLSDFTERLPLYTALDLSLWTSVRDVLAPASGFSKSLQKAPSNHSTPMKNTPFLSAARTTKAGQKQKEEGKVSFPPLEDVCGVWTDVRRYVPLLVVHFFERHRNIHDIHALFFGSWSTAACRCLRFASDVPVLRIGLGESQNPHAEALTAFFSFLSRCPKAPRDPLAAWRRNVEVELLQMIPLCFPSTKSFCDELLQGHPQRKRVGSIAESLYVGLPQMLDDIFAQEEHSASRSHSAGTTVSLPRKDWKLIQMLMDTLRNEESASLERQPACGVAFPSSSASLCFPLRAVALLCALKCRLLLPRSPVDHMYRRAHQVDVSRREMHTLSKLGSTSLWAARIAHRLTGVTEEETEAGIEVPFPMVHGPHRTAVGCHNRSGKISNDENVALPEVASFPSFFPCAEVPHLEILEALHAQESERLNRAADGLVTRPDPSGAQFADLTRELHRLVQTFFGDARLEQLLPLPVFPSSHTNPLEKEEEGENVGRALQRGRRHTAEGGMANLPLGQQEQHALHVWGELLLGETMAVLHQYGGYEDVTLHLAQSALFASITSSLFSFEWSSASYCCPAMHTEDSTSSPTTTDSSSSSSFFTEARRSAGRDGRLLMDVPTILRQMQFPCALHSPVPLPLASHSLSSSAAWSFSSTFSLFRFLNYLDSCLTLLSVAIPPSLDPSFASGLFASYRALYTHVEELNERERQEEELTVKYKDTNIVIEGDNEKMVRKLKDLFPSYENEFSALLKDREEEDEDEESNTNEKQAREIRDGTGSEKDEKKNASRLGNQARTLFSQKSGFYVRHLVEVYTDYYQRLVDGRLDSKPFSMELHMQAFKARFDTLATELREWSGQKAREYHGMTMKSMHDQLDDREECLLMCGFGARASLIRKEFFIPLTSVPSKNEAGFNIFKDPEPSEVSRFSAPLGRLLKRVEGLLEEYPENVTLLHCQRVGHTVGQLKALETPLMKVMTGCEVLLTQCYEWERSASSVVSLMPNITELSSYILRWRRLELHSWGHIFKAKREELELTASLEWFTFYDLIHREEKGQDNMGFAKAENEEDELTRCLELFQHLSPYLWKASIGDFASRLRIVKGVAYDLAACFGVTSPRTNVALHIAEFFSQFEVFVEEKCSAAVKPLEEDMKEFCQIMRWEDANYYAVRATVEKSHLKVGRVLAALEDVLRTPMLPLLQAEEERCMKDPAMGFPLLSDVDGDGRVRREKNGKKDKNNAVKNTEKRKGREKGSEKKAPPVAAKRTRDGKEKAQSSAFQKQEKRENCGAEELQSKKGTSGELISFADSAVSSWPAVAKAVRFFHDGAAEVIATVNSLQAAKVPQQLKLRSLKMMLDRLAGCGIPHTHEQQVEDWEVLYSNTEALLGGRSAYAHQLSTKSTAEDDREHSSTRVLTSDALSAASLELYRVCRWVQRMREAERHPHQDLSGAQVKRGTGSVESLLAHLIQLSRWAFQLLELDDGLSALMQLVKDGVLHEKREKTLTPVLSNTTTAIERDSPSLLTSSSKSGSDGIEESAERTLSDEYFLEGSHSEKASVASTELLNRSLQWVATLRSATSSFHWLQNASLTGESKNTASGGSIPTTTSSVTPPLLPFLSSSSSALSGVTMGETEEEGECTSLQVGGDYSTEDRGALMALHAETEKLWEMCVDGEVLRHQSPILPLSVAQRFRQQHQRLLAVCCRLQQQHSDPVVRAAASLCARSLSTEITSWEDRFYSIPPHSLTVARDSRQDVAVEPQQCNEVAEFSSPHWHFKEGTMWSTRQRRRQEVEKMEGGVERTPPVLPPPSETYASGTRACAHEFSMIAHYCSMLDVSFTLSSPTVQPDVRVEIPAKHEAVQGQEEFPAPIPGRADAEGKRDEDEEEREVEEDEINVYASYIEKIQTMHTATEGALRMVSLLLFMSPSGDASGESLCVVPERLPMRAAVWWQSMSRNEGMAVYAQLLMAKRIVEEAKCGAIDALKSHAFFGVVLSRLLTVLLTNGFCKSNDDEEQDGNGEGEQGGMQEGTGMDDGQGEKDVTNEMENEDQLMNEKDQQEQGENEKNKGEEEDEEDHAADVETDFAGEKEAREEEEEDEEDGSDQEIGEVGEEDEVQERKKSRRDAEDQEELNEDDGEAADEVPRDEFEENEENEDKETSGFQNKEEEIRKNEEEEEMDDKMSDRQIVGDEDNESQGTEEDGIEDDESDSQSGRSQEDSQEREEEKEDHELPLDDNQEADEDKKGDDEGQEGEQKEEEEEDSLSRVGEQDVEALSGEEENSQTDVESADDAADENIFEGGQQDDHVGEEATENKEEHEERSKEQRQRKDATGTDEQQEQNEDEQDDAGRNWKEKQEENASAQRSDNTQQRRSEQSNPYKAMKEALQRHQNQPPRQLQLSKEVQVQNKKENQEEKNIRKPKPEWHSDDEKDKDDDPVDHFEFDEEGEEEGMAATEEFAPPTVEEAEESNESEEENTEGAEEEDPEDERRKRTNPSDLTEISMEDEKEEKDEEQGRRQKSTQKKNKGKPTAALRPNEEEDDHSDEDGKGEANKEAPTVDEKLEKGRQRWLEHETSVQGLAQQLCEQLRLILAPTLADKLQGDYKTGKRLNMKRIIPYIASQFKKDRIWLRRTKPNKRMYQIMVALDDSLSMKCNEAGEFCCRAVTLMAKALQQLESGEVGIACFGEDTKLLHPLEEPFVAESGPRVFSEITFSQNSTKLRHFLEYTLGYLDAARERLHGQTRSTSQELLQLLYIFSDGQITENRADIRQLMVRAEENHQMVVFVILDVKAAEEKKEGSGSGFLPTDHKSTFASTTAAAAAPLKPEDLKGLSAAERLRRLKADREKRLQRVQSQSILEMQLVEFKGGQVIRKGYMEEFPFPYYLIVREMDRLPEIIADSMRQWFELLNGH